LSLDELREREYLCRREVMRLRRLVYEQPNPAATASLLEELTAAERALAEAEAELADAQAEDSSAGVILTTKGDQRYLGAETTQLQAEVRLRMEHLPTAIAHLLQADKTPLVSCTIKNLRQQDTRRLRVSAFIDGYSAAAVETVEIEANAEHTFDLLPVLYPEKASSVNEMTRAALNLLVEDLDGKVELHRSVPVWLLPRTSAPLAVTDPADGKRVDMTPYFGAFVTPNAPTVMSFVRKAADHHPEHVLIGYQEDESAVEPQVKAVFEALKADADITYVNSVVTFTPDEGFADQRVRLPRESLSDRQANCIDGTVLVASLLEAISLSPAIVVVPGHAFLGWETWKKSDKWRYLETTMIGSHSFEEACQSAEQMAARYGVGPAPGPSFRFWPLSTLRSARRITPME
jgi:hypothetical protein